MFASKDLKGAPLLELSKDGLKIKKNVVCRWASSEDISTKGISLLQLNSDEHCKANIFPFVTMSGKKYGEVQFWIIANGEQTDSYYSASMNGKTYYIEKKSVNDFSFKKSVKKVTSEKYKNNYISIKKYLAANPELDLFIDKVKKCIDKKDFQCLNISPENATGFTNIWAEYFCINHSEKDNKKFDKYCKDVKNYLCISSGGSLEYLTCDYAKPNREYKLEFSDLKQKAAAEEFFWDELKSCVVIEKNVARLQPPAGEIKSAIAEHDENYRITCSFSKKSDSPISWKLEWLVFREDEYGLNLDQIHFDAQ